MSWDTNTNVLVAQIRSYLDRLTDDHTRLVVPAWVRAWDDLAPELEAVLNDLAIGATDGRIRRTDLMRSVRLQRALEAITDQLAILVGDSADDVIARLTGILEYSGAMQERLIVSQLPTGEADMVRGWTLADPRQLEAIVTRTTEQITKLSFPLADEAAATMRRQLVRGIAVGANPRTVAARMVSRTEGVFNGGLSRALTIARTEMLDAHRAAAAVADAENADILQGWVWTASLSSRTCPACWGMNGQVFPLEQPGPEGHQNCRCARVPKTKTWADLGFEGMDEPPSLAPDAQAVFDGLPETDRRQILGPKRYAAYLDGDFPMDQWAIKRQTPGWRDSYVPAKAPAAA